MSRAYVDPTFPAALQSWRRRRELSLAGLSAAAFVSKSHLSMLEGGERRPTPETAWALDAALDAGGTLAALVTAAGAAPAERELIAAAVARPAGAGAATAALATVLAGQRRLDDALAAEAMLPLVKPQWATVMTLARDARGPAAAGLREVAAEWTQFLGWLHAEAHHHDTAARVLAGAITQADATGSGPLMAQARNFRGYVERQRGNPRGIVTWFGRAYHSPGASVLQRAGDAAQAAHGYALAGDRPAAARLLGEASDLLAAAEDIPPATAYWLSPEFSRLNLGLAYLGLGDQAEAAAHLRAGLAGLPPEQRGAEWAREYERTLATVNGEPLGRPGA